MRDQELMKKLQQLNEANEALTAENATLKAKVSKLDAELDYWCRNGLLLTRIERMYYLRKKEERLAAKRKAEREAEKSELQELARSLFTKAEEEGEKNDHEDTE